MESILFCLYAYIASRTSFQTTKCDHLEGGLPDATQMQIISFYSESSQHFRCNYLLYEDLQITATKIPVHQLFHHSSSCCWQGPRQIEFKVAYQLVLIQEGYCEFSRYTQCNHTSSSKNYKKENNHLVNAG
jgi:hypothetical protein